MLTEAGFVVVSLKSSDDFIILAWGTFSPDDKSPQ